MAQVRRTVSVAVVLGAIGVLSLGGTWVTLHGPSEGPCATSVRMVDGRWLQLQDRGEPGRDHCDSHQVLAQTAVLGFDCTIRAARSAQRRVLGSIRPNRLDGTCGQPDPGGPWPR